MDIFGYNLLLRQSQQQGDQLSVTVGESSWNNPADVAATAAVTFGVGLHMRAFALATMDPPIMRSWERAAVARDILFRGEWIAQLALAGSSFEILRASGREISGGASPRSWVYRLTIPTPSTAMNQVILPYDGVCHVRINTHPSSPWRGISPLQEMQLSTDLLRSIEDGLTEEEAIVRNTIVAHGPSGQNTAALRSDLSKPGLRFLEQVATGFRDSRTGHSTFQTSRIGPEPNPNEVALRAQVSQDVLSALGIPAGLYSPREGSVSREAYRQWFASSVEPMLKAFTEEMSEKLERPVTMSIPELAAADIASRGRALKQLIDAGVEPEIAAIAVGMSGLKFVEPEPPAEPPSGISGVPTPVSGM